MIRYLLFLTAWLAAGMTTVFLGGITPDSVLWWALYATPATLLAVLAVGLPALVVTLTLLLSIHPLWRTPR